MDRDCGVCKAGDTALDPCPVHGFVNSITPKSVQDYADALVLQEVIGELKYRWFERMIGIPKRWTMAQRNEIGRECMRVWDL